MVTFTELVYWNAFQLFLGQTTFPQPFSVLYTSYNLKNGKKLSFIDGKKIYSDVSTLPLNLMACLPKK